MLGAPTKYTKKLAIEICSRIANGESLRKICLDENMPDRVSIWKWLEKYPDFLNQYTRAREAQADALFDDMLHIADTVDIGTTTDTSIDGKKRVNESDMLAHRRLQIDTRKWMAGKLRPKKYGEIKSVEADETDVHIHGGLPD